MGDAMAGQFLPGLGQRRGAFAESNEGRLSTSSIPRRTIPSAKVVGKQVLAALERVRSESRIRTALASEP